MTTSSQSESASRPSSPPTYEASTSGTSGKPLAIKVIVIGDSSVGKTTLTQRFVGDRTWSRASTTTGVDLRVRRMQVKGENVKLCVWDTAGSERFQALTSQYYRGAQGAVLAYDISNRESFVHLSQWCYEFRQRAESNDTGALPKIVVGTKADLPEKEREVSFDEGETYADEIGALFVEASAVLDSGVQEAFVRLAECVLEHRAPTPPLETPPQSEVTLEDDEADGEAHIHYHNTSKCC